MASPRKINIIPECGLTIKVDNSVYHGIDHTHSYSRRKYKITNALKDTGITDDLLHGYLSPTSKITLKPDQKKKAGIPTGATSFAFMYPPKNLAEKLSNGDRTEEDACLEIFDCGDLDERSITSAVILGGFAYFDDYFNCLAINALSRISSDYGLDMLGPFDVHDRACIELYKIKRPQPLRLDIFCEVGFVQFAWVRPGENKIAGHDIFKQYKNADGAFFFFRENGTAVAYAVDQSGYVDPNGDVGFISDAIGNLKHAKYNQKAFNPVWRDHHVHLTSAADYRARVVEELKDDKTLLHKACQLARGAEFIGELLSTGREKSNLSYQDKYGWNPLHYACRFSPCDCDLVKLLIKECPEMVQQSDNCGRYPLHIACDSDTSKDVIDILLTADVSNQRQIISCGTSYFGLLPIHFACLNGASYDIIKTLLDTNESVAITPTKHGMLPLHLAILKKLPLKIVQMLLNVDTKLRDSENNLDYVAVYQDGMGKLPLHIACWNNSSSEIIDLLLEKDKNNIAIDVAIGASVGDLEYRNSVIHDSDSSKDDSFHTHPVVNHASDGAVPLHLAMRHGNVAVISLLLQKERGKDELTRNSREMPMRTLTLHRRDRWQKTPLHIACQYDVGHEIIRMLVRMDPLKENTQCSDSRGFRPIHYACTNKKVSTETIRMLLEAEESFIRHPTIDAKVKSTHCGKYEFDRANGELGRKNAFGRRTPLYLAMKNNISPRAICLLLRRENFTTRDFDRMTFAKLVSLVSDKKNKDLQREMINIVSDYKYFAILMMELYAIVIATISLLVGTNGLLEGDVNQICPIGLIISSIVFTLRELFQIYCIGFEYVYDLWNGIELLCVTSLFLSAHYMFNEIDQTTPDIPKNILCLTGFSLMVQTLYYLRSTILPFAEFVGGLIMILKELVPFLIVSLIVLTAFTHSYWVMGRAGCDTFMSCTNQVLLGSLFQFEQSENNKVLDYAFALLIVIVLLNVLIAVVSGVWEDASEQGTIFFWQFQITRISWLDNPNNRFPSLRNSKKFQKLKSYILEQDPVRLTTDVIWTEPPFHVVESKNEYDDPYSHFEKNFARKVRANKSLQANFYWSRIDAKQKNVDFTNFSKLVILFQHLFSCMKSVIFFLMGIITFGLFWSREFRRGIIVLGNKMNEYDHDGTDDSAGLTEGAYNDGDVNGTVLVTLDSSKDILSSFS